MKSRSYVWLAVLLLAPMAWAVGLYAAARSETVPRAQIEATVAQRAAAVMEEIDRRLQQGTSQWKVIGNQMHVRELLRESNRKFAALEDVDIYMAGVDKRWRNAAPGTLSSEMAPLCQHPLAQELRDTMDEFSRAERGSLSREAFLTNAWGALVAMTERTTDYYQADETWWRRARDSGYYIGNAEFDESAGMLGAPLAVRVDDYDGSFLGVLKAVHDVQWILDLLEERSPDPVDGRADKLYLWSGNNVVLSPTMSEQSARAPPLASRMVRIGSRQVGTHFGTRPDGAQVVTASARSRYDPNTRGRNWTLVIEHDATETVHAATSFLDAYNRMAGAATMVALCTGGWLLASRFRRLRRTYRTSATGWRRGKELDGAKDPLDRRSTITRLAGGVAHEFNNRLQIIQGHAQAALHGLPRGDSRSDDLRTIVAESMRAAQLTDQMLSFGRIHPLDVQSVDLGEMLKHSFLVIRSLVGESVTVKVSVDPDLPNVVIDQSLVQRALAHLCTNARDAMPNGGKLEISLRLRRLTEEDALAHHDTDPGDYVALAVSDNGHGMPQEILERAFEPFVTTKEEGAGAGMGLAFVYGIVKQHGGDVTIQSKLGKGTRVEMLLPVQRESQLEHAPAIPRTADL